MEDIRFSGHLSFEIVEPGFVQVERSANYRFSYKTGKAAYSFIFVQKGEMDYYFIPLKKHVRLEKNMGIFIPKNLPYTATYMQTSTQIKILTFDVVGNNVLPSLSKPISLSIPELSILFASISQHNLYSPLFLSSKIYELLHYIETTENVIPTKYQTLRPALMELKQQYFKNEKIAYYAQLCLMSESNFRKLFKEYTGHSPITYRNLIRISAVQTLLNTGETTISEAAYLVGFNNMSFFYQVYNKYKNN